MKYFIVFISSFLFLSCISKTDTPVESQENSSLKDTIQSQKNKTYNISEQWHFLADSVGGCLVGGQYCGDGQCGSEGCCFDLNEKWKKFFKQDALALSSFLISQLSDTSSTSVHVCPYFRATKGELAVYALHRIYKTNWFDLDSSYKKYIDGSLKQGEDFYSLQSALQKEISDRKGLQKMTHLWEEKHNQIASETIAFDWISGSENYLEGKDFDGDQKEDHLHFVYTGGAHCCYKVVLKLSSQQDTIKFPFEIDGGYEFEILDGIKNKPFDIEDFDQDGQPEIFMNIFTYNGRENELPKAIAQKYNITSNYIHIDFYDGQVVVSDYHEKASHLK